MLRAGARSIFDPSAVLLGWEYLISGLRAGALLSLLRVVEPEDALINGYGILR